MSKRMGSRRAGALLILWVGALPAQTPPPKSFDLAFSPPAGATLVYSLTTRLNSEGRSFLGTGLTLGSQASGEIDLSIRQKSSDSVFVDLSSPGIRVAIQVLDQQNEFSLDTPADDPVRMVLDHACRVRSVANADRLEERNPMNFSILDVLRNFLPALPDRPVAPGDTWQDHKRLQIPFQEMRLLVEIETTFQLRDVSPTAAGLLAMVDASYTVRLSGSKELENVTGTFEGQGAGTGSLSFLVDKGYFSDYRLDYSLDGAMVVGRGSSQARRMALHADAERRSFTLGVAVGSAGRRRTKKGGASMGAALLWVRGRTCKWIKAHYAVLPNLPNLTHRRERQLCHGSRRETVLSPPPFCLHHGDNPSR